MVMKKKKVTRAPAKKSSLIRMPKPSYQGNPNLGTYYGGRSLSGKDHDVLVTYYTTWSNEAESMANKIAMNLRPEFEPLVKPMSLVTPRDWMNAELIVIGTESNYMRSPKQALAFVNSWHMRNKKVALFTVHQEPQIVGWVLNRSLKEMQNLLEKSGNRVLAKFNAGSTFLFSHALQRTRHLTKHVKKHARNKK